MINSFVWKKNTRQKGWCYWANVPEGDRPEGEEGEGEGPLKQRMATVRTVLIATGAWTGGAKLPKLMCNA